MIYPSRRGAPRRRQSSPRAALLLRLWDKRDSSPPLPTSHAPCRRMPFVPPGKHPTFGFGHVLPGNTTVQLTGGFQNAAAVAAKDSASIHLSQPQLSRRPCQYPACSSTKQKCISLSLSLSPTLRAAPIDIRHAQCSPSIDFEFSYTTQVMLSAGATLSRLGVRPLYRPRYPSLWIVFCVTSQMPV